MKKIVLIDGFSLLFRAFFAMMRSNLRNNDGFPTGALHAFFNMTYKFASEREADSVIVAFDTGGKTFRHDKFTEYKAGRKETPDELIKQIPVTKEIVQLLGWTSLEAQGYEADDIIGTICSKLSDKYDISVLSGDRDLLQLVDSGAKIFLTKKGISDIQIFDIEELNKEYGLTPAQFIDYKALMGDNSDNIPGLPGVGPKTALKLLHEYKDLENIYKNADLQTPSLSKKIKENWESALMSKELATIYRDIPIDESIVVSNNIHDENKLFELLNKMELNGLIKKIGLNLDIPTESEETKTEIEKKYESITDINRFNELINCLNNSTLFSIDLETDSEDQKIANIVGISFCFEEGISYYIPITHSYLGVSEQLGIDVVLKGLSNPLIDPKIKKICHNLKYEYTVFKRYGIEMKNCFDTMLASYLLDPEEHRHSLDNLSKKYFNYDMIHFKDLFGKKEKPDFSSIFIERATEYAAEDSDFTYRLYKIFSKKIHDEALEKVLKDLELPLVPILSEMENAGILLDRDLLYDMSKEFEKELNLIEKSIFNMAGVEFNLNSPKQLENILFEKMGLPTFGKTAKGTGYSTGVGVLEKLNKHHEIAGKILEYRTLSKLKSTYLDALPKSIKKSTGRLHTSFNQTVAATGRLSSSNPNLQNIPARGKYGKMIRSAFIAPKGMKLVSFDYSQVELRVLAHMCGDENLRNAFINELDIHTMTASKIFEVNPEDVKSDMRRKAKEINFGVVYGLNAYGLSDRLGISNSDAKRYLELFFMKYPGIKDFIENTISMATEKGFVTTLFGRKRWLDHYLTKSGKLMKHGENVAVNAQIQGSAADIIKLAMIKCARLPWDMLLQIHDELIFEVPESEIEEAMKEIRNIMENVYPLSVPLKVDGNYGNNWGELK